MKTSKNLLLTILLVTFTLPFTMFSQDASPADSLNKKIEALKKDLDPMKKLKISGWAQLQYQQADSAGVANLDGGDFSANSNSRFMIRRGRVKFTFEDKLVQYVVQVNMTERFVNIADLYGKITDPWTKWMSLQVGLMNRPFGYDIQMSSSVRESPERARYTQMLTPNERDMGAELIFEAPKNSKFYGFQLTGGLFNGTGLAIPNNGLSDIDSKKDFIGRVSYYKGINNDKIKFGIGASHYNGGERMANNVHYTRIITDASGLMTYEMEDSVGHSVKGNFSKRIYYGFEGLFSVKSVAGTTTLRGEYVFGKQPGSSSTSKSPQTATSGATYDRNFTGAYAFFIHRIMNTRHEIHVKYEWYDPNANVSGDAIGKAGSKMGWADLKYSALGLGYNFYYNDHYKFLVYYNMVTNESSKNLTGYAKDLKDNILTLRVQVKF